MRARRHFTRGLRFRLTVGYALLFALLLIGTVGLFRERLAYTLNAEAHDLLEQEWAAMKGYLRIDRLPAKGHVTEHPPCGPYEPKWEYDKNDPDEDFAVERLRRVYLLTDAKGCVMQVSTIYQSMGIEPPREIEAAVNSGQPVWKVRTSAHGIPYLTRSGVVFEEKHHTPFYVVVGRPMDEGEKILTRYTWMYFGLIPVSLLCGCLLGWFLTGRALMPVTQVAQTAQRITGSNLSLRIPSRGAGDEFDYLILTFNRMIERLESSFQQIRQFSTDVSHELRTPITAIRGQLEVALFTAKTVDQYRDAIFNSLQDIERLSQIVRALLLLSQAESGQLALQKTRLNLASIVRDIVEQFQIPAEGAHVALSADLPPDCPADVDRVQIERMLSNLLSNAMKFTPAGGEVRVTLRSLPDVIEIEVADTGCGIAEEHIPHIFERFYRVPKQETAEPGLGLGLSFVAWIAKAHGGSIRVDSTLGNGTRFTIVLPNEPNSIPAIEAVTAGAAVGPDLG